jgi:muramidase (phage lysozyme)
VAQLDEKFRAFEDLIQLAHTSNAAHAAAMELQSLLIENKPLLKKAGKYDVFIQQLITFCAIAGVSLALVKGTVPTNFSSSPTQPVHMPRVERVQTVQSLNKAFTNSVKSKSVKAVQDLSTTNRQAMLRVIRFAEGTADDRGYNRIFAGQEVDDLSRHPDICVRFRRTCSTAAGAYQFLTTTWNGLGLGEFNPTNQDKGAIMLIQRRGALADVDAGRFEDAIAKLSPEWASLPRWEGDTQGTYKQPVKSMQELREVYLAHGGKFVGQQAVVSAPQVPAKSNGNSKNLLSFFFNQSKAQAAVSAPQQQDLAQKIVKYMERQGYEITRNPQEVNIIHVRNGKTARDRFEDKRIILQFDKAGKPRITGEWAETTKPGLHVVKSTPRADGAIFIAPGQYKSWEVGIHYGMTGRHAHEALVQVAPINGVRDRDRDGSPDNPVSGMFGVNIHAPWSDGDAVEDRSAGCMVTQTKKGHREFMEIVKRDRRFLNDSKFIFSATIIDGEKL